jgi:hypothetical protein
MEIKYSKGFERDYNFYLKNLDEFNFCGTLNPKHAAIYSPTGMSARQCFYYIESQGKNKPCKEPELLNSLLLTKASVNFQIKEWAAGRADETLPLVEFSKRHMAKQYPDVSIDENCKVLAWVNNNPVYHRDIETQYGLPEWVIDATEKQKVKLWR